MLWYIEDYPNSISIPRVLSYLPEKNIHQIDNIFTYDFGKKSIQNVVCLGTLTLAKKIFRKYPEWIPGAIGWNNIEKYYCSSYYPIFHQYLLNKNYIFLPLNGVLNCWKRLEKIFNNNKFFIRPDSPKKSFTGSVFNKKEFEIIKEFSENNIFVLISSVKKIEKEYRLIIYKNKVLSSCQYINKDNIEYDSCPIEINNFANKILSKINFDDFFVLDLCINNDKIYIMELNALSTSDWYICDHEVVIKKIEEYAKKEYNQYLNMLGVA